MAKYVAITGGVGGAKLALGLSHILDPNQVAFVVNTGDDFEHLGLHISPDIDTLTYTLANRSNKEMGWGRQGETWQFMQALTELGGQTWFNLGDQDLALHVQRTLRLGEGVTLTEVTREITTSLGVQHHIFPMTDNSVQTIVKTASGDLAFQHYFVRDQCEPTVTGFEFSGCEKAGLTQEVKDLIKDCSGVIICPSNPYVSVDPVLAVPGMREALKAASVPIVAITPIIAGAAIKGPTAKMMRELNVPVTSTQVAQHYQTLISGFIYDHLDADNHFDVAAISAQTIMVSLQDRIDLATTTLEFIQQLKGASD